MENTPTRLVLWALRGAMVAAVAATHPVLGLALLVLAVLALGDDPTLPGHAHPLATRRPREDMAQANATAAGA